MANENQNAPIPPLPEYHEWLLHEAGGDPFLYELTYERELMVNDLANAGGMLGDRELYEATKEQFATVQRYKAMLGRDLSIDPDVKHKLEP